MVKRVGEAVLGEIEATAKKVMKFGAWEFKEMDRVLKEKGLGEKQWDIHTSSLT